MCGLGWLDSEHQVKLRNNFRWSVVHVRMDWIDGPLMMGYLYLLVWLVWNISIWAPEEGQLWSLVGQDVLPGKVWSLARKDWMVEVFRSSRLTPGRNRGGEYLNLSRGPPQLWSLLAQDVLPGEVWSLAQKDWMVGVLWSSRLIPGRNRGGEHLNLSRGPPQFWSLVAQDVYGTVVVHGWDGMDGWSDIPPFLVHNRASLSRLVATEGLVIRRFQTEILQFTFLRTIPLVPNCTTCWAKCQNIIAWQAGARCTAQQ